MLLQLRGSPVVRNAYATLFRSRALTPRDLAGVFTLPSICDGNGAANNANVEWVTGRPREPEHAAAHSLMSGARAGVSKLLTFGG